MYSAKVLKHFYHPQNMGKLKNPDSQSKVGNPVCGDLMSVYLKIKKNKIADIKFETLGCPAAIATSSVMTAMAKGRTLQQAKKISFNMIAEKLGGLPKIKLHCSHLAVEALQKAIKNYEQPKK